MIRRVAILFLSFYLISFNGFAQNIDSIRKNYQKAATDQSVCQSLMEALDKNKISNLELAYLGALQTIWAKYVRNPFTKLSTFKKGKEKIEKAVKEAPDNPEIRYLRLSIQKNAPKILGYNKNVEEDTSFFKNHLSDVESESLKKRIMELIKSGEL